MQWQLLIGIIPGLLIFIYGIGHLSHEIQRVAGRRFKKLLATMTKSPIRGVVLGTAATSVLQSSSATTLIVVSLVNAGALTLEQSLGVIFGANIGTTVTSQLVAFKLTVFAPIFLVLGFLIGIFGRHYKFLGKAVFYFGLVFFALHLVGQAVEPIRADPAVMAFFANLTSPILGVIVGFVFTAIVQSSSVTSGIAVLLGIQGLITPAMAIPIILGANVGTTSTTLLSSVGMEPSARRAAFAHTIFNAVGVLIILPLLPWLIVLLTWLGGGVGQQIANGHIIFNIGTTIIFLIFLKPFAKLVRWMVPSDGVEIATGAIYIKRETMPETGKAIRLLEKEVAHQVGLIKLLFQNAVDAVKTSDQQKVKKVAALETATDDLDSTIMEYLLFLSKRKMTKQQAQRLGILMNVSNALENLGDTGKRVSGAGEKLNEHGMKIQKQAALGLEEVHDQLDESLREIELALNASKAPDHQNLTRIRADADRIVARIHNTYLKEITKKHLDLYSGPLFGDALTNMEHANHMVHRIGLMLAGKGMFGAPISRSGVAKQVRQKKAKTAKEYGRSKKK